jgi:hypothetical protein
MVCVREALPGLKTRSPKPQIVMLRESGASSIPEAAVTNFERRGVLGYQV